MTNLGVQLLGILDSYEQIKQLHFLYCKEMLRILKDDCWGR